MDSRPPNLLLLLLLTSLLHFDTAQCATGESSYIIDAVGLTILPNKTVESGTPVTIRCQVKVSHTNIPNLTHAFQLKRNDVVIHSSTTIEDSVVYELNPARAADSGSYDCRVTVKDKSRASSIQKLDVIGLQTPILYLNKTTFYEGDDFIATCGAPEEKGSLMFRFFQRFGNKKPENMKQLAPTGNSSETTLVLRHAGNYSLYCDYVIHLVSGTSHSDHSNEIQVEVEGVQISPSMNVLPSANVTEGDVMEVVCKVNTSQEKVEVFLTKNSKVLKKARVSLNHRFIAEDSGKLVCKAERGNVQKETYKEITVQELFSKPRLTLEPVDLFVGDHFKLTCSVSVYFPERIRNDTMQFSIYKDNNRLTTSQTFINISHPDRNGNYTCRAQTTSLTHNIVKESQTLVVKAKIPVSKPVLSVVGGTLVLGKSFQLLCHSDNGTLPITYTLFYSDKSKVFMVVSNPGEQAIFNSSAILERSELNKFICHAKNGQNRPPAVGSVQQLLHSINIIEPVSRPELTIVPSMGEVSEGQDATLTCSVNKGTPPIIFTWYHTEMKGALDLQTSKTLEGSYFIQNVRGEHKGGYYCVSTNLANETKQSYTVMIRVKMAGWKKGLIAVLCILLILALFLVIAIKTRFLQFKRKTAKKLSVKSASTKVERLSLTQAEVNEAANVTPGMIGKSVWSEHVSGSESDDQNSVTATEPQYKEVKTRQADPNGAPVETGTDTVYSEVRNSKQGVPEQADGGSVEYAQLNHDTDHHGDHGEHTDHSVQDDHIDVIDNSVDTNTADHGE
ncbi:platelet endothelial cell adhesion molecule-like isoform X2 [Seriola dumerili]|uniref:platelet endothelial cell adhesion molecule-like isoform X2 n=1 Tax=Seriola dumerili TaxID=41447 RepID=UPI000BBE091A|nr:platelet endothelial cell adhesion molecule-like isoform X2 [Seriola dumerili]